LRICTRHYQSGRRQEIFLQGNVRALPARLDQTQSELGTKHKNDTRHTEHETTAFRFLLLISFVHFPPKRTWEEEVEEEGK
jgi:hypothetical protein